MLLGPVFRAEMARIARRRRNYALRTIYGLLLLMFIWQVYTSEEISLAGRPMMIEEIARFATGMFMTFSIVQLVAILALIPSIVAGAIADEKQRKTLHYLMASRLTGAEIVLDKMAARLLNIGVYVALSVPIMCLLSLLGGIAPALVVGAYAVIVSSAFFVATLAMLCSTLARKVRQAVVVAYVLTLAWTFVPVFGEMLGMGVFPKAHEWYGPVNRWLLASSPMSLWFMSMTSRGGVGSAQLVVDVVSWMIGLQVGSGLVFLLIAVWQLRPTFRRQESGARRMRWFRRGPRWQWARRPPCGDDAMLWKECHFARTDVFTKMFVLPATVLVTVALVLFGSVRRFSGIDETSWDALKDLVRSGYRTAAFDNRIQFNNDLRDFSYCYIALWLLAVAGASASSVSVEREEDTWVSLTSTPLTGREILVGKMIGAVWGLRGFAVLIGLLWLAGLITGAVHPLGIVLGLAAVGVLTWFVSALGAYLSLKSRSTSRALSGTVSVLILLNAGYLAVALPLVWSYPKLQDLVGLGYTPGLASNAFLSFADVDQGWQNISIYWLFKPFQGDKIGLGVAIMLGYLAAAVVLTWRAVGRFDDLLDRPRESGRAGVNPSRSLPSGRVRAPEDEPALASRGD